MIDERSSSSFLTKRFLNPKRGLNPQPSDGSSMIRASHRSSECCGLDPRLGLTNLFSEDRV